MQKGLNHLSKDLPPNPSFVSSDRKSADVEADVVAPVEANVEAATEAAADTAALAGPVRITGMASGGEGVGRLADGRVVFVNGGLPGDLLEPTNWRLQKKSARADIGRLIESSPDRVEPKCPHFGSCGGCRWQHLRYSAQLEAKRAMVSDALERIGGLAPMPDLEIKASPDPYGYRARARLVESDGGLGYRIRGSREIEKIQQCPVLTPASQDALRQLMQTGIGGGIQRAVSQPETAKRKKPAAKEWILSAGTTGPAAVRQAQGKSPSRGDAAYVTLKVLGESLRASSNSFMQGNALLWDALAEEVCRQCLSEDEENSGAAASARPSPKRFVELYAGIGFLTIPLARRGLRGVAIESDQSAVQDLSFNLARSGLAKQVEIVRGRVESRRDLAKRLAKADLLVVDPPRVGLDRVVRQAIASDGPARVVYVSCDPATLARDLRDFVSAGYRLSVVRAMDLFPQTPHVEIIVRLDRSPAHTAG
ncbi:MAG: class I SAM-dependent RNA methyltransferase [Myxococcota bacterium]